MRVGCERWQLTSEAEQPHVLQGVQRVAYHIVPTCSRQAGGQSHHSRLYHNLVVCQAAVFSKVLGPSGHLPTALPRGPSCLRGPNCLLPC